MAIDFKKSSDAIGQFIQLRLIVGYLGERKQCGWWDCDLLDATGLRFLETVFPRTARAAALRSTTEAACIVHDKALGRVGNYHLFRLPPALEDRLENCIDEIDWSELGKQIDSRENQLEKDEALPKLLTIADSLNQFDVVLEVKENSNLHDRETRLSNGWTIKIGRGFDIYQRPDDWLQVGANDLDLRPCLETNVDVIRT